MTTVIFTAFGAFLLFFLAQIVLARVTKPRSEDRFIVLHWVLLPMGLFGASWGLDFSHLARPADALAAYLLFFVLASSWVASYPVIYGVCPTLIISLVVRLDKSGTPFGRFKELLGLHHNSMERIDDAVHDSLIRVKDGAVTLTPMGRLILAFYKLYRGLLGLPLDPL